MLRGMAHLHRFFFDDALRSNTEILLDGDEAHHALHAVRVRPGQRVALINGRGEEAQGEVLATTRHEVRVACATVEATPAPERRLAILQAALHNPKATEFLVKHGTELGVQSFVFFRGRHSERVPNTLDKLQRTAIEAMKQSGRRWLPALDLVDDLDAALDTAKGALAIASMDATPVPLAQVAANAHDLALLIGPEGDFAPEETERALARGAQPLSLGAYTYRSEVAATLLATLVQHAWGTLGPQA